MFGSSTMTNKCSTTVSFDSSPAKPSPASSLSMVVFQLKDFNDFTYADMISSVDIYLGALVENKKLQMALKELLSQKKVQSIREISEYCKKTGGLLGHRKDILNATTDDVLSTLSVSSISQRVKEIQALQLFSEAITSFSSEMIWSIFSMSKPRRAKLLQQFKSTPIGANVHSFADRGAFADSTLQPILEEVGYKVVNGHLQLHRDMFTSKDTVRAATMAVLAIDIIID